MLKLRYVTESLTSRRGKTETASIKLWEFESSIYITPTTVLGNIKYLGRSSLIIFHLSQVASLNQINLFERQKEIQIDSDLPFTYSLQKHNMWD